MTILVYSAQKDSDEQRLLQRISFTHVDLCRSIDQLKSCLNVPREMRKIVILVISDHDEMIRISKLIESYPDLLMIVILNQDLFATARDVHKLRPRYITYKDGDFQDVAAVLSRIINHYSSVINSI
jgi:hypothetical protein